MITALLRRPARHPGYALAIGPGARPPAARVEVCPPSRPSGSVWSRLTDGLRLPDGLRPAPARQADRLGAVREEFCAGLADIPGPDADDLVLRMRHAGSLHELWHLRTELFTLVSLHHSQDEARQRLARLNRHFPCRAPRSAFAPLDGA